MDDGKLTRAAHHISTAKAHFVEHFKLPEEMLDRGKVDLFRVWSLNPGLHQASDVFLPPSISGKKLLLNRIGTQEGTYNAIDTLLQNLQRESSDIVTQKAELEASAKQIEQQEKDMQENE